MKKDLRKILWFTGLSGSGKTTLARALNKILRNKKYSSVILDGDEIRAGLCSDLKFSDYDRAENIRRIAELASLLIKQHDFVIVATISPNNQLRKLAKKIIGKNFFNLVYLSITLEKCIIRDPKGLYKKVLAGKVKNFTGFDSAFERPRVFDLKIDTSEDSIESSIKKLLNLLRIK